MGSSPEAFQLLQFTFNGKPLAGRRTARAMSQVLPINLEEADGRCPPVTLSYRTLVQQNVTC
jgi:hypothetical protein